MYFCRVAEADGIQDTHESTCRKYRALLGSSRVLSFEVKRLIAVVAVIYVLCGYN